MRMDSHPPGSLTRLTGGHHHQRRMRQSDRTRSRNHIGQMRALRKGGRGGCSTVVVAAIAAAHIRMHTVVTRVNSVEVAPILPNLVVSVADIVVGVVQESQSHGILTVASFGQGAHLVFKRHIQRVRNTAVFEHGCVALVVVFGCNKNNGSCCCCWSGKLRSQDPDLVPRLQESSRDIHLWV